MNLTLHDVDGGYRKRECEIETDKMPAILALREMPWLIHLFQLCASQIYKTILANGIV